MNIQVQAYIDKININDITLNDIILKELDLVDGDILTLMTALANNKNMARQIRSLYIKQNRQLTAINIPEELVALTWLDLQNNQLIAINIPAELVALHTLKINGNQLFEINIPAALVALTWLELQNNQLTAIKIPAELVALRTLKINGNQLFEINIPAALVALTWLELQNNQLTEIKIPAELVALEILNLNDNQLNAINIPGKLVALESLDLNDNQLTEINIPAELVALEWLWLEDNPLTDATKIALNAEIAIRGNNFNLNLSDRLPNNEVLTLEILDAHFKTILQFSSDTAFKYLKEIGAPFLLSQLPKELVIKVGGYMVVDNMLVKRANTSLDYFINLCSRLHAALPDIADQQEALLNNYKVANYKLNIFEQRIESFWLKFLDGKTVKTVTERIKNEQANLVFANQSGTTNAPMTWAYNANSRLRDETRVNPANNPFQVTLFNRIVLQ